MGKSLSTYSARAISCNINYVGGNFSDKTENFHEGLNSDCHTLLIYRDSFDIRTNQGTSRLLHKKIQY